MHLLNQGPTTFTTGSSSCGLNAIIDAKLPIGRLERHDPARTFVDGETGFGAKVGGRLADDGLREVPRKSRDRRSCRWGCFFFLVVGMNVLDWQPV